MDAIKIYKYALALPLVVPIVAGLILYVSIEVFQGSYGQTSTWSSSFNSVLFIIAASGVAGGIPYLILVGLLSLEMKKMNEQQIRTSLMWLPILMIALVGIVLAIYALFADGPNLTAVIRFLSQWAAFSFFILIFGYGYVFLTFTLVKVLRDK